MRPLRFFTNLFQPNTSKLTPETLLKLDGVLPGDYLDDGYPPKTVTIDGLLVKGPSRRWEEMTAPFHQILWRHTQPQDTPAILHAANPDYLALLYPPQANAAARAMHSYVAFEKHANSGFRWGGQSGDAQFFASPHVLRDGSLRNQAIDSPFMESL